jgi:hypothetical protein
MADYAEYTALLEREQAEIDELNATGLVFITQDHFGDTMKVDQLQAGAFPSVPVMDEDKHAV